MKCRDGCGTPASSSARPRSGDSPEVRAHRLRELRERAGLRQAQLAERIGVGQRQVSKIEHGDLDSAKIGTIRSYLGAVGGGLAIEYVIGDQRIQVA